MTVGNQKHHGNKRKEITVLYWNKYREDSPFTYVSTLSLEKALELFYNSLLAYSALCEVDTPFGATNPAEDDDLLDAREVLLFVWRNIAYDLGYRKAPFPNKDVGAEPASIKEYIPEKLQEEPNLPVEPGVFGHREGDIMLVIEDLYSVGIRNGLTDLRSGDYALNY